MISCEIERTITSKSFMALTVELKLGLLQNARTSEQLLNQSSNSTSSIYSSISNIIRSGDIILEDALFDSVVDYHHMDIKSPVQVHIQLKEVSKHTLEIFIRLIPNISQSESNLSITRFLCVLPLPSLVANVTFQLQQKNGSYIGLDMLRSKDLSEIGSNPKIGEMCQYRIEERQAHWQSAPFRQGEEPSVVIRITSDEDTNMSAVWKRRLGLLYCDFTIPDYATSGINFLLFWS
ncbi:MAG: hypothetical protein EZS28_029026 [Streblomastix strix]|uniref:Uncharacterized protein n=1 Tax=Streblomastix strix TaxID=222440 RepID=A0A5J4UYE7_9EUKA|nr:MAG: hypothetical protein EZS28_029026 [Streblomastix strix]